MSWTRKGSGGVAHMDENLATQHKVVLLFLENTMLCGQNKQEWKYRLKPRLHRRPWCNSWLATDSQHGADLNLPDHLPVYVFTTSTRRFICRGPLRESGEWPAIYLVPTAVILEDGKPAGPVACSKKWFWYFRGFRPDRARNNQARQPRKPGWWIQKNIVEY